MKLPKVPYINVFENLDIMYEFNKKKIRIGYSKHKQQSKKDALIYGKNSARRTYYFHYLNKGLLPKIYVDNNGNGFVFEYMLNRTIYTSKNVFDNETIAWDNAICSLFENMNIGRNSCEFC